jgi:hypothetical protein
MDDEKNLVKEQTYFISIKTFVDGTTAMLRRNDGFTGYELMGILHYIEIEIHNQINGSIKPDIVKREFIEK